MKFAALSPSRPLARSFEPAPAPLPAGRGPAGFRRLAPGLSALALCLAAGAAGAADVDVQLRYGQDGSHFKATGISARWGALWSKDWGSWKGTVRPELEATRFRYSGPGTGPDSLSEVGGIGLFRLTHDQGGVQPYAEAGLGLAYFSDDKLGNKEFSTRYQFSEHLGLGLEFARRWFVGWRFSHYSNADIKKPNNGLDLHQFVVGGRF